MGETGMMIDEGDGDGGLIIGNGDGGLIAGDGDGGLIVGDGDGGPIIGDGDGGPIIGDGDGGPIISDGDGGLITGAVDAITSVKAARGANVVEVDAVSSKVVDVSVRVSAGACACGGDGEAGCETASGDDLGVGARLVV